MENSVILEFGMEDVKAHKRIKAHNVMIDRVTGEAVSSNDIDDLLDKGVKVFVSFGGDPIELKK